MSHVAIVIPGLDRIGGAERQAMLLAKGLRRRGWRVTMVALSGNGGAAAAELRGAGVAFLSLEMRKGLADPRGRIRYTGGFGVNGPTLFTRTFPMQRGWRGGRGWRRRYSVVIDTLHSSHTENWAVDRLSLQPLAAGSGNRGEPRNRGFASRGRDGERNQIAVVGNGIDVDDWRPDEKHGQRPGASCESRTSFCGSSVGRLEHVKDFPALLRAMARLPKRPRLLVLGAGPLHNELVGMAARLGMEQQVQLCGIRFRCEALDAGRGRVRARVALRGTADGTAGSGRLRSAGRCDRCSRDTRSDCRR